MQLTSTQIMQVTHEQITLVACEQKQWQHFKDFHYQKLPLSKSAKCHLAVLDINGTSAVIGFCAAIVMHGKYDAFGTNAYRAHKAVVRMPESPEMFHLWSLVSDKEAQLWVAQGVLFYSRAPILYAAYRDNPATHWVATCKDADARQLRGERSHEYKWAVSGSDKAAQKIGYRSHEYRKALTAADIAEAVTNGAVVPVPKDVYSNHSLAQQHFRGSNPGGYGKCFAYVFEGNDTILGFALMKRYTRSATVTLTRLIVDSALPKDENIFVGQSLVKAMCREYPAWHSVTSVSQEAEFYHAYYQLDGVLKSEPTPRKILAAFAGIPISIDDWQSREFCDAFVQRNPEWHEKIIANAQHFGHLVRPGGTPLPLAELQNKILNETWTAGRILHRHCPTMQITYSFVAAIQSGGCPARADSLSLKTIVTHQ